MALDPLLLDDVLELVDRLAPARFLAPDAFFERDPVDRFFAPDRFVAEVDRRLAPDRLEPAVDRFLAPDFVRELDDRFLAPDFVRELDDRFLAPDFVRELDARLAPAVFREPVDLLALDRLVVERFALDRFLAPDFVRELDARLAPAVLREPLDRLVPAVFRELVDRRLVVDRFAVVLFAPARFVVRLALVVVCARGLVDGSASAGAISPAAHDGIGSAIASARSCGMPSEPSGSS